MSGNSVVRFRCGIIAVLAVSLLVSIALAWKHGSETVIDLGEDAACYHSLAVSILDKHTYSGDFSFYGGTYQYDATHRAPGYPAFLSLIFAAVDEEPVTVYMVQAFMLPLVFYLVYLIVLRITGDRVMAFWSLGACVVWPFFYSDLVASMLPELLAAILLAGALCLLLRVLERPSIVLSLLTGLLMGAATLTKVPALPFALLVPFLVLLGGPPGKRQWRPAASALLGVLIVLAPWTIRNYRVTGAVLPVTTGGGLNLWVGSHTDVYDRGLPGVSIPSSIDGQPLAGKTTVEKDRLLLKDALCYIKVHPLQTARLFGLKFCRLWLGELGTNPKASDRPIPSIGGVGITRRSLAYVPVFILAVLGWFKLSPASRSRSIPLLLLLGTWSLCYMMTYASVRYAAPLQFYVVCFAAVGVRSLSCRRYADHAVTNGG